MRSRLASQQDLEDFTERMEDAAERFEGAGTNPGMHNLPPPPPPSDPPRSRSWPPKSMKDAVERVFGKVGFWALVIAATGAMTILGEHCGAAVLAKMAPPVSAPTPHQ
jgi:hypothetical protein